MIVSASCRTDIPAFYGAWFVRRLRAGFCRVVNPYNRAQRYEVSLRPEDVDGFVFWTKDVAPFLDGLGEVRAAGLPFFVQYSLNGYPTGLEPGVPSAEHAVAHARGLAERYGPRVLVWRYDTVVFSSLTPPDWHRRRFAKLAAHLEGATDEVVTSFLQPYRKSRRNLDAAAAAQGFTWHDPAADEKRALLADFVAIAASRGMRLSLCSQPELLVPGAGAARCIDARRLEDIGGRPLPARSRPRRPGCGCDESRDIGAYDTCAHGCVYCYAVRDPAPAARHARTHDPADEYLRR